MGKTRSKYTEVRSKYTEVRSSHWSCPAAVMVSFGEEIREKAEVTSDQESFVVASIKKPNTFFFFNKRMIMISIGKQLRE